MTAVKRRIDHPGKMMDLLVSSYDVYIIVLLLVTGEKKNDKVYYFPFPFSFCPNLTVRTILHEQTPQSWGVSSTEMATVGCPVVGCAVGGLTI